MYQDRAAKELSEVSQKSISSWSDAPYITSCHPAAGCRLPAPLTLWSLTTPSICYLNSRKLPASQILNLPVFSTSSDRGVMFISLGPLHCFCLHLHGRMRQSAELLALRCTQTLFSCKTISSNWTLSPTISEQQRQRAEIIRTPIEAILMTTDRCVIHVNEQKSSVGLWMYYQMIVWLTTGQHLFRCVKAIWDGN